MNFKENALTKALCYALAMVLIVGGCAKVSDDETDPQIVQFNIADTRLEVGDLLEIEVGVTDNEALVQLRLRMEEAFSKSFGHWEWNRIDDISGQSYFSTYAFQVPDSALAGYYEVSLQVADERGNASPDSSQFISIIRNDQAPSLIDFETQPAYDGQNTIQLSFGDTLSFMGQAFDADSLATVSIVIQDAIGASLQTSTYNIGDTTQFFDFGLSADSLFFNFNQDIPTQMLLKVTDSEGHLLRNVYPIDFEF